MDFRATFSKKHELSRKSATSFALGTLLLLFLFVAATVLRFDGLDRESRYGDEYYQTMAYSMPPQYVALWSATAGQPPLDSLMGWAVVRLSSSLWAMRAPAAFFGVLSVGLTFVVVRRVSGMWLAGLFAAGIVAFSPLHWRMSQTARPYTIFIAALLLMAWALVAALEKPDRHRLAAYGLAAYAMTLTRGLAPLVILLCTGAVLWVTWWTRRKHGAVESRALRRTGLVTIAVGLAAVPMLLFLLHSAGEWANIGGDAARDIPSRIVLFWDRLTASAAIWWQARGAMFGPVAAVILLPAALGLIGCGVWWRRVPLAARCLILIFVLSAPVYLLVFCVTVEISPIRQRYGLFLVPVVSALAGVGLAALLEACTAKPRSVGYALLVGMMGLLLWCSPAQATLSLRNRLVNPDWRGSAAYLADKVSAADVIIVLADRPLGKTQPPYWGKLEWPKKRRPLAESVQTLATSPAHWKRLLKKSGQCFVVLKHEEDASSATPRWAHFSAGTTGATFHGLDVVYRVPQTGSARENVLVACADLLAVDLRNPEVRAWPLVLRSRLLLEAGRMLEARASYAKALELVPPKRRAWFENLTAPVAKSLASSRHR